MSFLPENTEAYLRDLATRVDAMDAIALRLLADDVMRLEFSARSSCADELEKCDLRARPAQEPTARALDAAIHVINQYRQVCDSTQLERVMEAETSFGEALDQILEQTGETGE